MVKHPRYLTSGDIITAADWNDLVRSNVTALEVSAALEQKAETPAPPSMLALASVAAVASVSQKPISRRRLLRFWHP